MQYGLAFGTLLIAIPIARRGHLVMMVFVRSVWRVAVDMRVDFDPRDIGQREAQRQRYSRNKACRLAEPAMQPNAQVSQVHLNSMPQLAGVLNPARTQKL
jgi:hypothetical protein